METEVFPRGKASTMGSLSLTFI